MKYSNQFHNFIALFLTIFMLSSFVAFAGNPASPFTPAENVQDPGDPGTSWGGWGPTDSNCYVTFAMPSLAAPTVDSDGEIAYDTTVADFSTGIIRFYGTEEQGIISMPITEFTAPTDGQVISYNATNDEFELVTPTGAAADSLDYDDFEDTMDFDAALTLNQGTNTWSQTYTGTISTGHSYTANSLTSGSALAVSSSSITSGSLVNLTSTSTAAVSNLQKVLNVSTSGANANANQTTYGGYFSNTHTGSGALTANRAIYATASGGYTNTALYATASGGTNAVGIYATASGGSGNNYAAHIDGILALGSGSAFLIEPYGGGSLSLGAGTPPSVVGSLFFGSSAGSSATNASNSNFLGSNAGNGATNASNSNFLGSNAGNGATNADDSNFFGEYAGYQVTAVDDANFFGYQAGYQATSATDSNFFGYQAGKSATNSSYSNFFGYLAGELATDASGSNFFGYNAGNTATNADNSIFIGSDTGNDATNASSSIFLGAGAGLIATNAANSIFIGEGAGNGDSVDNTVSGSSILIGINTDTGNFSNSIAIGYGATNTASNQLVFGSDDTNSYIDNVFFGTGAIAASPVDVLINGSGASGTNIAGADIILAGGKATGNATGGSVIFQTADAGASGATLQSLTTKAILLASGNFGIGDDTTPDYLLDIEDNVASSVANFFNDGNATTRAGIIVQAGLDDHTAAGPSTLVTFNDGDGGTVGSITFGSSLTAYNTTSDKRLKENIEDTSLSIDDLMDIQVRDFTWRADKDNKLSHGFIAQELYEVYPGAVTVPTDDNDYYMVDYSKLMPLAIKSIQDLNLKLNDIQNFEEENNTFGNRLRVWLGNATNKISRIFTGEICLYEEGENSVCLNRDELKSLKELINKSPNIIYYDNTNDGEDVEEDLIEENNEEEVIENTDIEEIDEEIDQINDSPESDIESHSETILE